MKNGYKTLDKRTNINLFNKSSAIMLTLGTKLNLDNARIVKNYSKWKKITEI